MRDQKPLELIVVDDGSLDRSAEVAAEQGATVLRSGGRRLGPAYARNVGVAAASGDVVLFVDADVLVGDDVLARVRDAFADPATTALFGSYDDDPDHAGFASQYMNLRHHRYHQEPGESVSTFWAGLGAVRRTAFEAVGGFDAEGYPRPSVEDIDLGIRLVAAGGRIRRDPSIQGKHLKRWTLAQVVSTDVFQRAMPWTELMVRHPGAFTDLNVSGSERWKAVLAMGFWASSAAALTTWVPFWIPLALLAAAVLANLDLARLFARVNGPLFALGGLVFHQLYYVYGVVTFAACRVHLALRGRPV